MPHRSKQRGSLIVAALLLFSLLLALGLGLMSSQAARMKAAQAQADSIQAKSLALAAWADVKTKLGKDLFFPPTRTSEEHFSYSEDVYHIDKGIRVLYGSYSVMIDTRYALFQRDAGVNVASNSLTNLPIGFYLVTCVGKLGPRGESPAAERELRFELDPQTFQVIRMHDMEGL